MNEPTKTNITISPGARDFVLSNHHIFNNHLSLEQVMKAVQSLLNSHNQQRENLEALKQCHEQGLQPATPFVSDDETLKVLNELKKTVRPGRFYTLSSDKVEEGESMFSEPSSLETPKEMKRTEELTDADFCEVCNRPFCLVDGTDSCSCKKVQPYALSKYPGEFKVVKVHPDNEIESQFYKRTDIDPSLDALSAQAKYTKELENIIATIQLTNATQALELERVKKENAQWGIEVRACLELEPLYIKCCEGGSAENLAGSLALTMAKTRHIINTLTDSLKEASETESGLLKELDLSHQQLHSLACQCEGFKEALLLAQSNYRAQHGESDNGQMLLQKTPYDATLSATPNDAYQQMMKGWIELATMVHEHWQWRESRPLEQIEAKAQQLLPT